MEQVDVATWANFVFVFILGCCGLIFLVGVLAILFVLARKRPKPPLQPPTEGDRPADGPTPHEPRE